MISYSLQEIFALGFIGLRARARVFFLEGEEKGMRYISVLKLRLRFCCKVFCVVLVLGPVSLAVSLSDSNLAHSKSTLA